MMRCAVGIWAITERNLEKNSVATSNSPLLKRASTFCAIASALTKPTCLNSRRSMNSMMSLAN
ncbi:hypothetical protein D3C72_2424720 [compost metagenome]